MRDQIAESARSARWTHTRPTFRGYSPAMANSIWEVVAATLYDRGNPDGGAEELSLVTGPEEEARRVYADTTAIAADRGYSSVVLRRDGVDVESWPQATGWTS
ncbi:hypothetical protein MCHLDSM_05485 [Mycolicibacterium chlorophenolicum]|uniref:Uncharacterized protein n=2 Tax=Mycolicibacterium chlorophenolicum TaxID=37916 RepID=A0A0J6VMB0_9MYCO|nr:hypothetical protein MCHLDSM_05485 [Mycolicibacterium chlorophenolicum]